MHSSRRFVILTIGLAIVMLLSACQSESPERARLTPLNCQTLPDGREVKTFELGGSYWRIPCEAYLRYNASSVDGGRSANLHPVVTNSGDIGWGRSWTYPDGEAWPINANMRISSPRNGTYTFRQIARATRLNTEFADLEPSVRASPQQFGSRFYWLEGTRHDAIIGIPLEKDSPFQSRWIRCDGIPEPAYSIAPWTDWLGTCRGFLRLTPNVTASMHFHSSHLPLIDELVTNLHAELMNAMIPTPILFPEL